MEAASAVHKAAPKHKSFSSSLELSLDEHKKLSFASFSLTVTQVRDKDLYVHVRLEEEGMQDVQRKWEGL